MSKSYILQLFINVEKYLTRFLNVHHSYQTVKATRIRSDPSSKPRRDYHKRCPVRSHPTFGKQRHTCRHCVVEAIVHSRARGMSPLEAVREARAVSRAYFCHACMIRSVRAGRCVPRDLRLLRSCRRNRPACAEQLLPTDADSNATFSQPSPTDAATTNATASPTDSDFDVDQWLACP